MSALPVEKLRLNCLVWPDEKPDEKPNDHLVEVKIDNNESIMFLRKLIKEEHAPMLDKVATSDLVLWKCSIPDDSNLQKTLNTLNFDSNSTDLSVVHPFTSLVSEHFATGLSPKNLHILVEVRRRKKRPVEILENWHSKRHKKELPSSIPELIGALKEPLRDDEKIPITEAMYTSLISKLPPDKCDENTIETLFKIGEFDPEFFVFFNAVAQSAPAGGTEDFFHVFWDCNIRRIIEYLIPAGKAIRNSNRHTETRNLRPDYGFLLRTICPFRGEEKGPDDPGDPKAELGNKLNWVYEPAPYMLGYYCWGSEMTLAAITAPNPRGSKPNVHDLLNLDLSRRKGRISNICHLINLANILPVLADLMPSPLNDFKLFQRTNSTVEITSTVVIKTYTCKNAEAKVQLLRRIYDVIATRHIPNTDALVFAKENIVHLSPRGIIGEPLVAKELRECVICILESLRVAHQVIMYHRDIRWDNVIRRIEDHSKWFLIDWEDAASPPTTAQLSFATSSHSPAVFENGHGADVDIWGVGHLIKTCGAFDVPMELRALGDRFCNESQSLSAEAALELVDSTQTYSI